jgi:glycosyltransferase 2 family protein
MEREQPNPSPRRPSSRFSLWLRLIWQARLKILKFALRWGIAVAGITWIVMQLTIRDRINVVLPSGLVESTALKRALDDDGDGTADRFETATSAAPIPRSNVVSQPDRKTVKVHQHVDDPSTPVVDTPLLGLHLKGDLNRAPIVDELIIKDPNSALGKRIRPADVVGGFTLRTPRPVVEKGLVTMGREANPWLLVLAIAIFPITMVITSVRWREILRSQDIRLPFSRVFVLNMVGNFYNSFLPGSTGGDFLKAFYASRQTNHKIRAMLSVFIDRVIGLLALVILGGTMAAYGFFSSTDLHAFANDLGNLKHVKVSELLTRGESAQVLVSLSPNARACLGVAVVCLMISFGAIVGGAALISRRVRTMLGFNWFVSKLPMQHHLDKVREAGRLYRKNVFKAAWWIALTFPIHITVVISAMIAGKAFGLGIAWPFYFVCVPVMVLVASLPISPQGAGVMEYFGFLLLAKQGATVSEVLALTLSIRFVQIFWNLIGGLFMLGGNFHAPTATYDAIADEDTEPAPA